jgi:hypothetical protein
MPPAAAATRSYPPVAEGLRGLAVDGRHSRDPAATRDGRKLPAPSVRPHGQATWPTSAFPLCNRIEEELLPPLPLL